MFNRPVVVVDIETTSLDPYNRVVWDIGMVRRNLDGSWESQQTFVELTQREIDRADPESLEIGGFEERYNEFEALSKNTVAHLVRDYTRGAYLAGVCVDFDVRSLTDLLYSRGLTPEWDYHILDIRTLAAGYLHKGNEDSESIAFEWRQDAIAQALGVDPIEEAVRHTGLGDAEWEAAMLRAIINE